MTNPDPLPGDEDLEDVMSELKATPGPWMVTDQGTVYALTDGRRGSEVNRFYARVSSCNGEYGAGQDEIEANAHLIADSPTMFYLLKNLVAGCEQAIEAGDWKVDGACDPEMVLSQAKKLIARHEQ